MAQHRASALPSVRGLRTALGSVPRVDMLAQRTRKAPRNQRSCRRRNLKASADGEASALRFCSVWAFIIGQHWTGTVSLAQ